MKAFYHSSGKRKEEKLTYSKTKNKKQVERDTGSVPNLQTLFWSKCFKAHRMHFLQREDETQMRWWTRLWKPYFGKINSHECSNKRLAELHTTWETPHRHRQERGIVRLIINEHLCGIRESGITRCEQHDSILQFTERSKGRNYALKTHHSPFEIRVHCTRTGTNGWTTEAHNSNVTNHKIRLKKWLIFVNQSLLSLRALKASKITNSETRINKHTRFTHQKLC